MAKKSSKMGAFFPILMAVAAFIVAILLPGAVREVAEGSSLKANLLGMMFGSAEVTQTLGDATITGTYKGAMSIFGLISAICLIIGAVLCVSSFLLGKKKFLSLGSLLILIAGILVFMLLVAGSDLTSVISSGSERPINRTFKEAYENFSLGIGAYVYGALCILGGLVGLSKSR